MVGGFKEIETVGRVEEWIRESRLTSLQRAL